MKLSSFGISDIGRVRAVNEDRVHLDDELHVYAVADGLGGLPGGSTASEMTVAHIREWAPEHLAEAARDFKQLFARINETVHAEGQRLHPGIGIGTTLTCVKAWQDTLFIGHVGDSSAYLIRRGTLSPLTEDHTLAAELESRMGSDWEEMPEYFYHTLTRCIGQKDTVEVDEGEIPLQDGDRILLCTDGLTKVVGHEDILNTIEANLSPEAAGRSLIEDALKEGAPDNVSLVLVYVHAD
ncbi:MAG: protein phosphatase [Puniceicoccaceae bacterium 5H]|nr:MAG: protein phosphatase [Puniceicoccaceae bacterium 5H]